MNWTDIVNGLWEAAGVVATIPSIRSVLKTKSSAGVKWGTILFFEAWGIWNVFFYPMNGHMVSFYGGVLLALANLVWLILLIKYRKQ